MDIEISSVILGVCFLATFFIPIMYSQIKQKSQQKKISERFLEAAKSHQLIIKEYNTMGNQSAIGIDTRQRIIFFFNQTPEGVERTLVDLREVEACKLINVSRTLKAHSGKVTATDRLGIRLLYRRGRVPDKVLLFYDAASGVPLGNEFFLAEKWKRIIQENL